MGSIPGPIIRFRFDQTSVKQAAQQVTKSLQSQLQAAGKSASAQFAQSLTSTVGRAGKTTAEQFASAWATAAAKLRSQLSTEKLGLNQIVAARQRIIALAKSEADALARKNALSKSELSTLKAATLEIERQKSFLSGTGGLTGGTRSVIQQLLSGISARAGSFGGGLGSFAGVRVTEPLGKFAEEAAGLNLALLGTGAAAVGATAALVALAKRGAEFAVEMRNAAEASGISIKSAVELRSVSKVLGIDFDTVSTSFRKFDREITLATQASLPHASYEAVRAGKIFEALGVNVAQAAKDPAEGMAQLSQALSKLPDGAIKSAVEIELLGRGGREAAPLLNHFAEALAATKNTSDTLADKIGGAAKVGDTLAATTANLSNQWHILETSLATVFVPALTDIIGLINRGFSSGRNFFQLPGPHVPRDLNGNPITIPQGSPQMAAAAMAGAAISLGKNPGALQTQDALKKAAEALAMDSTGKGRGGRSQDFSEPLFLGTALEKDARAFDENQKKKAAAAKKAAKDAFDAWRKQLDDYITLDRRAFEAAKENARKTAEAQKEAARKAAEAQQKAAHEVIDAWKEWQREGQSIFDSLLSGGQNFAHHLVADIESILLKPVRDVFGNIFGNLLQNLSKIIQSKTSTTGGKTGTSHGGILGKIADTIRKLSAPPTSVQQAQQIIDKAQIQANTVYLNGPIASAGGGVGGSGMFGMNLFGGTSIGSLSSLAGIGGMSLALAGAGGTAVAGSGGSAMGVNGGMAATNGGSIAGTAAQASGALAKISGNRALQAIAPLIPGAALLGAGIATRNGAAMALGIGSLAGAGLTQLSRLQSLQGINFPKLGPLPATNLGNVLGTLGAAAPGIGMMFAGNQTGGLGGAALGALGGAEAGAAIGTFFGPGIGTAIGAGIGAVAGAIMGIFGKKDNTKAWNNGVQKAINNQRITQPLSENFAFAATNAMASTFGTTFSQGPGGFSNSTLPANTPFWARAILGTPHGTSATIAWNALMNGMNPNSPFFGGTNTSPFNGGPLVNGLRLPGAPTGAFSPNAAAAPMSAAPSISVAFHLNGFVDKGSIPEVMKIAEPHLNRIFNKSLYQNSSGTRRTMARGIYLP